MWSAPNFIGVHRDDRPAGGIGAWLRRRSGRADRDSWWVAARYSGRNPQRRTWDDYFVGRDTVQAHLAAVDLVYNGVIEDTRKAIDETEEVDRITKTS
jgi:starvation-inducible DNA-binding protein